jgi:hypothetical protein
MMAQVVLTSLLLMFADLRQPPPPVTATTTWSYEVISTPDFKGQFRGSDPSFTSPDPINVAKPDVMRDAPNVLASCEAIVGINGHVTVERHIRGGRKANDAEIRAVIGRWRFRPATLEGKPIRVRIRVMVQTPPAGSPRAARSNAVQSVQSVARPDPV